MKVDTMYYIEGSMHNYKNVTHMSVQYDCNTMIIKYIDKNGNECEVVSNVPEFISVNNKSVISFNDVAVLDKIRLEVEKLQKLCDKDDLNLIDQYSAFGMVLDIIDKYKAESKIEQELNYTDNDTMMSAT